jgi:predicted GNAT family acetyltransferase
VAFREKNPKRAHLAWIVSVCTHPASRRQGLCRGVLTLLMNTIQTWPDIAAVLLSVSERATEARRLYESLGFAAWGTEPDAIRIGDQSFAETHMRLTLERAVR